MKGTHLERLVLAARATMEERLKALPLLDVKAQAYARHDRPRQFARSPAATSEAAPPASPSSPSAPSSRDRSTIWRRPAARLPFRRCARTSW
jgi:hypothetical protein